MYTPKKSFAPPVLYSRFSKKNCKLLGKLPKFIDKTL